MKQDSWLNSDSFLKRAFAVWGHNMVANLIVAGVLGCMLLLSIFIVALSTQILGR